MAVRPLTPSSPYWPAMASRNSLRAPTNLSFGSGARLADAADRHAAVARLDDHPDAPRLQLGHDEVGDRLGHPLLHLRPLRHALDDAGQLRQPDDLTGRQVGDVGRAGERQ